MRISGLCIAISMHRTVILSRCFDQLHARRVHTCIYSIYNCIRTTCIHILSRAYEDSTLVLRGKGKGKEILIRSYVWLEHVILHSCKIMEKETLAIRTVALTQSRDFSIKGEEMKEKCPAIGRLVAWDHH